MALDVVRVARHRCLELRFLAVGGFSGGLARHRGIAGEGPAGLAGLGRLIDEETEEQHAGGAPYAPEKPAQTRAVASSIGRRLQARGLARADRCCAFWRRFRLEREQGFRGLQLERVALPGKLLGSPLAGGILELAELAEQHLALPRQIARLEGGDAGLRGPARR